jgi:hypothetical protein
MNVNGSNSLIIKDTDWQTGLKIMSQLFVVYNKHTSQTSKEQTHESWVLKKEKRCKHEV